PGKAETILGDLSEEFSSIAVQRGAALARRWYWRQGTKTAAHLLLAQAREAPWILLAIAVVGWYLPVIYGTAIKRGASAIHARCEGVGLIGCYAFWVIFGV